jgi:hypothetical protein
LYCLSLIVELQVALTEVHVRSVLMPADHEVPFSLDPLNCVKVVLVALWKVE